MIRWIRKAEIDVYECDCGKIIVTQAKPVRCRKCGKSASGKPVGRPKATKDTENSTKTDELHPNLRATGLHVGTGGVL